MRFITRTSAIAASAGLMLFASAMAHENVQNPAVKARMDAMSAIGAAMKTLGTMAKGTSVFDQAKADAAASEIAEHAARVPDLFEAQETDPKTEAKPEIWTNFEDFTAKSNTLVDLAQEISSSGVVQAELNQILASLGGECKACHSEYRE